jgi:aspartate kinase
MNLQVYKFGGASVKDAAGVRNLAYITSQQTKKGLLIVVSAMGKTTNALETLTKTYLAGEPAEGLLQEIAAYHEHIMLDLFKTTNHPVFNEVANLFVEIEWVIEEEPHSDHDFIYDQIVSIGELVSSRIVHAFLKENGGPVQWVDARSLIQTDNTYREGRPDWNKTEELIQKQLLPVLREGAAVTQGFIGGTTENYTTTLGREGSDYSAAIFASCLGASSMTIWKDVPGVLNADPKLFSETQKYDHLHYSEALEMTYYGATVIHPKTIKPLQNAGIPLFVKPFSAPGEAGTRISNDDQLRSIHPAIIVKKNQVLLSLSARDHSFVTEENLSHIFSLFAKWQVKINIMQMSAISFSLCIDMDEQKFGKLKAGLENNYLLKYNAGLELITVRHFNKELTDALSAGKTVLMEQQSRSTAQFVVKQQD